MLPPRKLKEKWSARRNEQKNLSIKNINSKRATNIGSFVKSRGYTIFTGKFGSPSLKPITSISSSCGSESPIHCVTMFSN